MEWVLRKPASTHFEDASRSREQLSSELLGEVTLSESPVENGKNWVFRYNRALKTH